MSDLEERETGIDRENVSDLERESGSAVGHEWKMMRFDPPKKN